MALSKLTDTDMAEAQARGMGNCMLSIHRHAHHLGRAGLPSWLRRKARGAATAPSWVSLTGSASARLTPSAELSERKPFKLVLISAVATLLNLVIGGAIIGAGDK